MIRVDLSPQPPTVGRCMFRITDQLTKWAPPEVTVVKHGEDHDLQILQAFGPECKHYLTGKPYALMAHEYVPEMLDDAIMVASWIPDLMDGDRFLPLPLGADPEVFYREPGVTVKFRLLTSGHIAATEFVHEAANAAHANNGMVAHLGGDVGIKVDHQRFGNVSDGRLRMLYAESQFVSALRIRVGFEMMGVEGLMCGVRPIIFDRPDQDWFRKWSHTIHEDTPGNVEAQLVEVLSKPPVPLSEEERAEIVATLSWEPIAKAFWSALLARL